MQEGLKTVIAKFFWEIGAIKVSVDEPFRLTSGRFAPFYIDCRMLISYPIERGIVTTFADWLCRAKGLSFDYIAGGETAGIPFAAWLAEKMGKPFIYVRKKPKGHGTGSQLEGHIETGKTVLLYEDLITDGGSKISFINGIRQAGCVIRDCLVLMDRRQGGDLTLKKEKVDLYSLVTVDDCLRVGKEESYLSAKEASVISEYLRQDLQEDI